MMCKKTDVKQIPLMIKLIKLIMLKIQFDLPQWNHKGNNKKNRILKANSKMDLRMRMTNKVYKEL